MTIATRSDYEIFESGLNCHRPLAAIPEKFGRQLGNGIELVKEDIFWAEGQWSIRKGEMVSSKTEGWMRYYELRSADCRFRSVDDAMKAWENSKDLRY